MVSNFIEKKITLHEFKALNKKVLEEKGRIFIKQDRGNDLKKSPYFSFNMEIFNCSFNSDGLKFQIQGGNPGVYIDIVFDILKGVKIPILKAPAFDVKFIFNANPDFFAYLLCFDGICITYNIEPSKFNNILNDLIT
ncbi:hypothetical protein [Clostridium sp. CF012]|uniref:hypothetical protein n=1 Tax=Clostridium sp. CF012 TaxID=2843319 RepID=UPI001C0C1A98|nr:hypothetical protein [Clostridium sp. CF012]MBU3145113.1 hypothetical protein [Clostridium sp. CF012]